MAFDCLALSRRDLRRRPLHERRHALEDVVDGADRVLPVRRLATNGLDAWDLVKQRRYEGLVAKDDASPYRTGESRAWVKIKFRQDARFVVGGVGETADGAPRLLVGELVARELVYRGAVELGVGPRLVAELMSRGRPRATSPFPALRSSRVIWLEPTIAVEVSYGRVMQGWLREPVCRGLVEDRRPQRRKRGVPDGLLPGRSRIHPHTSAPRYPWS